MLVRSSSSRSPWCAAAAARLFLFVLPAEKELGDIEAAATE
jgi:hypothetical protein